MRDGEFTLSPFGEIALFNNTINVICVQIDDRWAAIEIHRSGDSAHLTFVQTPLHLHTAATFVVARLLDIAPHRLTASSVHYQHLLHLCGWRLVHRWIMWFDLVDEFQDEAFHGVADHFRDIIHLTLECSVEDWRSYSAPPPLIQLATRLRKKFLIFLARRESQQDPVPQKALIAAFPVRQRPLSSAAPAPPLTPEEIASRRIEARLQHMLRYSGWMATDEMDFSIQPATLFCAPHNLLPEYGAYTHIIWFVIHNNHWLQFECYRQGDRSRFLASVPIQQRGSYVPLIQLLMDDIGLDRDSIPIDFVDQTMPRDLCGYYLLANIFYRLGLRSPPLDVRDQMLSQGLHGRLIDRVRLEARRAWMRAEGLPDFVIFAANIRDWFLLRVKTNRFPDHVLAAGAIDVTMDPGQNRPRPQAGSAAAATAGKPAASSSAAKGVDSVWVSDPWRHAMQQTHRLQLAPNRGGIVLLTKSFISEAAKQAGKQDLALLLPVTDHMRLPHLANKLEGPFEVAMKDEVAKITYKRLVHLLVIHGKCTFKLPEPKCKITTAAMCELVLEVDSRLCQKSD